ncbi:MAG: hypothetical protein JRG73_07470 [Deltaproteobacteria bacterium]|nr:hypothetical protein [Deltaproteobacteria bacterium]MBW2306763.1 hypothetical protein [Deltaproteobacteria bacterium]
MSMKFKVSRFVPWQDAAMVVRCDDGRIRELPGRIVYGMGHSQFCFFGG